MDYVKIEDDNFIVKLPVQDNKISLKCLQSYFPNASTITYKRDGEIIGIEIDHQDLKLVKNVIEYNVYYPTNFKKSILSDPKQKRINEIMAIINKEKKSEELDVSPKKKNKISETSSSKKSERLLFIGWKHKYSPTTKYVLMKEPVGGLKNIKLNVNIDYSIEDITAKAVEAMKSNINEYLFKHSEIKIGSFYETIFESFTDENGKACSFWEFAGKIKGRNRQMKIYLLSMKIRETTVDSLLAVNFDSLEETQNLSDLKKVNPAIIDPVSSKIVESVNEVDEKNDESIVEALSSPVNSNFLSLNLPFDKVLQDLKVSIPVIDREDLTFSSKECGRGSQGSVTVASWLGTKVAVKTVKFCDNNKYLAREIDCMSKLRHPNIVSIMAVSMDPFSCFIVMEYFPSETLRSMICPPNVRSKFCLTEENKNHIATQICTAVTFLHEQSPKIVHKDIKPENILVNCHCLTKLCDFGLSKVDNTPEELCTTIGKNVIIGTPLYMAPEILLLNSNATTKSDVWAVACVLKELYSGTIVWDVPQNIFGLIETLNKKLNNKEKPDLRSVPKLLTRLITACFEYEPEKRPKCSTLLDILNCCDEDE